jgi:hypothetical protein
MDRRNFIAGGLGLATLGALRGVAWADGAVVQGEIMILHATQQAGSGSIDPQIGSLPQLKKPPFSAYNTYKLVGRTTLPLEKGKLQTTTLVNKRVLQVTLVDTTPDKRYRVAAAINQPGGSAFLKLLEVTAGPNEPFFVAGQSHEGGILVIGITLKP